MPQKGQGTGLAALVRLPLNQGRICARNLQWSSESAWILLEAAAKGKISCSDLISPWTAMLQNRITSMQIVDARVEAALRTGKLLW